MFPEYYDTINTSRTYTKFNSIFFGVFIIIRGVLAWNDPEFYIMGITYDLAETRPYFCVGIILLGIAFIYYGFKIKITYTEVYACTDCNDLFLNRPNMEIVCEKCGVVAVPALEHAETLQARQQAEERAALLAAQPEALGLSPHKLDYALRKAAYMDKLRGTTALYVIGIIIADIFFIAGLYVLGLAVCISLASFFIYSGSNLAQDKMHHHKNEHARMQQEASAPAS